MTKTAISVPARMLAQLDRAARKRGESRSRFIQRLLAEALRAQSDAEFTARLDAFFSTPGPSSKEAPLPADWTNERW